jgi:hypothetical protein
MTEKKEEAFSAPRHDIREHVVEVVTCTKRISFPHFFLHLSCPSLPWPNDQFQVVQNGSKKEGVFRTNDVVGEFASVASGAAIIRLQHKVAQLGQLRDVLRLGDPPEDVRGGWAAVGGDDERCGGIAFAIANWVVCDQASNANIQYLVRYVRVGRAPQESVRAKVRGSTM